MNTIGCIGIGISGAAAIINFSAYALSPQADEAKLIRGTAAYITEYKSENPKVALDVLGKTMDTVKKSSTIKKEDVANLEQRLGQIKIGLNDNSNIYTYKPVLENYAKELESTANKYSKNYFSLALGCINLLCGGLIYSGSKNNW